MTDIIWGTCAAQSLFLVGQWGPQGQITKKGVHFSRTPGPKTRESSRETYKNMFRDIREQQAPDVTALPSVAELAEQMKEPLALPTLQPAPLAPHML